MAAGQGTRIGGTPKQYRPLGGVPIVLRALLPFTSHREVAHVALVLPPPDVAQPPPFLAELAGERLILAAGGRERGESVAAGLAVLPPACSIVLVHDAARPFVEPPVIDAVIREARAGVGALAAVPLTDTVKEASQDHHVARTLPRERLWRAHTPQGFPRDVLVEAHARAAREGINATDDASLVEQLGVPVRIVPDSSTNLKITTPDDLAWAEAWVAARG